MTRLLRRIRYEWPAWCIIAFVALMPFRRLMEVPIAIFAFSFFYLLRSADHRAHLRRLVPFTGVMFLCFWIPALLSNLDSLHLDKSLNTSLFGWRYGAAAMAIGVWLRPAPLRSLALKGAAFVVLFWAVDGYVQVMTGVNLLGFDLHPDRVNGIFGRRFQFFGPVLAMLSPLPIEYARRHWGRWAWLGVMAGLWGIVLLAGMRAGWVAMGVVTGVYFIVLLQSRKAPQRRLALLLPALALALTVIMVLVSPQVRDRLALTVEMAQGSSQAFDHGSSYRLPLWRAALDMYANHPVTGVGVRAFGHAHTLYAAPDDPHLPGNAIGKGGSHAHNIVLEVMSETGTVGLVGLLLIYIIGWRGWLKATRASRREALPWALVVFAITFPLNSHFAIYGVTTSSMIWVFVGLWGASLRRD